MINIQLSNGQRVGIKKHHLFGFMKDILSSHRIVSSLSGTVRCVAERRAHGTVCRAVVERFASDGLTELYVVVGVVGVGGGSTVDAARVCFVCLHVVSALLAV